MLNWWNEYLIDKGSTYLAGTGAAPAATVAAGKTTKILDILLTVSNYYIDAGGGLIDKLSA